MEQVKQKRFSGPGRTLGTFGGVYEIVEPIPKNGEAVVYFVNPADGLIFDKCDTWADFRALLEEVDNIRIRRSEITHVQDQTGRVLMPKQIA